MKEEGFQAKKWFCECGEEVFPNGEHLCDQTEKDIKEFERVAFPIVHSNVFPERDKEYLERLISFLRQKLAERDAYWLKKIEKGLPEEKEMIADDEGFERCIDKMFSLERGRGWNLCLSELKKRLLK